MGVGTVVDVHSSEDVVENHKGNVAEVHVVEVHYSDVLLIMVWSHFEVHYYKKQIIHAVKISQYLLLRLRLALHVLQRLRQPIRPHYQYRMHLLIKPIRVNKPHLQPMYRIPRQFSHHLIRMILLQPQQPLIRYLRVKPRRIQMLQYDLILK